MTGFVIATLVVGAVVAGAFGLAMLFDMALAGGARTVALKDAERRRWRPPFVQGRELFEWARATASGTVDRVLREPPDADTPRRLTMALEEGLEHAMVPGSAGRAPPRTVPCPEVGQGVIALTAPEAITLAECLREGMSAADLERVRSESEDNVGWIRRISSVYGGDAPCALQQADCVCAAWPARPLQCRAVHAVSLARAGGDDDPWLDHGALRHAEQIGAGTLAGLRDSLRKAGLDDGLYEMHSALARALEVPDAAERWARGENVFATCYSCDVDAPPPDAGWALH